MNCRRFCIIFSARLGMMIAVGEHIAAIVTGALGISSVTLAMTPTTLPTGAQPVSDDVRMTTTQSLLTIQQSTPQAIINWRTS
jgi:hypothetical protein